jgi:hypothetical protein
LLQEFPRSEKTARQVSSTEKVCCHHSEVLAWRPSKETLPAGNLTNNTTTKSGNFHEYYDIRSVGMFSLSLFRLKVHNNKIFLATVLNVVFFYG